MYNELRTEEKKENTPPLVSIWCVTYNHVSYIRDAIEGFLMQVTEFPYEIVIHDDASTDGTVDILKEYELKYQERIHVVYQQENIYKCSNRMQIINNIKKEMLKGKYVAYCEGDDYWTDPYKLQKQVEYLDSHDECIMTTHNAEWFDCEVKESRPMNCSTESGIVSIQDILYQNRLILQTSTIMIRNEYMYMPDYFRKCGVGDYPLRLYVASNGYIYYMDDIMSVYRYSSLGSWSSKIFKDDRLLILHYIKMIDFLEVFNIYSDRRFEKYIITQINIYVRTIIFRIKAWNIDDVKEMWKQFNQETEYIYHRIISKIDSCYMNTCDEKYYIERMKDIFKTTRGITLWGAGTFGKKYFEEMKKQNIEIDGFVTTQPQEDEIFVCDKKVTGIEKFLGEKDTYTIVVSVGVWNWIPILETILDNDIKCFYSPYYYSIY